MGCGCGKSKKTTVSTARGARGAAPIVSVYVSNVERYRSRDLSLAEGKALHYARAGMRGIDVRIGGRVVARVVDGGLVHVDPKPKPKPDPEPKPKPDPEPEPERVLEPAPVDTPKPRRRKKPTKETTETPETDS